jgi:large conductance mechanosensitive channel
MAGIVDDFKKFLMQGNVVDLAVAVIIGGAFGKIVESLVKDIVTPGILSPILAAAKLENIKQLNWNGITYGNFLAEIINFLVIAASIFVMIRLLENSKKRLSRKQSIAETAAPTTEEQLVSTLNRLADTLDRR